MDKARSTCHICGDKCSGKNLLWWREGAKISVCKRHWIYLNDPMRSFKELKDMREEVSRLKKLH